MDIEHLQDFYELVIAGGLRRAAEIKNLHSSTLTQRIKSLERKFGHELVEMKQGKVGVKLTRQGKVLFDAIPRIIGTITNTKLMMESDPELSKGEVTIYTTTSIIEDWLVPMLPNFFENFPLIHLNLMSHDVLLSDETRETVISITPQTEETENIIQTPLLDFHVRLWASKEYLDRFGRPKTLNDLYRHRLIVYAKDLDKMTYPNVNWHLKNLKIKREDLLCIHSTSARIKAAQKGLGIISLSEEAIQASGNSLEKVMPDIFGPTVRMCLTYPIYFKGNKIVQDLEEFLKVSFLHHLK